MTITAKFNYPVSYRLGAGRIRELAATCKEAGMKRPLIVTDEGVRKLPWFAGLVSIIESGGLDTHVFSGVDENPVEANITQGVASYRVHEADGIVLVGGGSPLDAGKCVAVMARHSGGVFDYEDVGDNWLRIDGNKVPPMIAVPTTAGTGSEVGRASVITSADHQKKIIFHPRMQPGIVLADPELTVGLPRHLTAFTGIDAFTHSFEAFCAPSYHPLADGIALEGMRLVHDYLPRACENGADLEARSNLLVASAMGATAFQKGLGVVHAIAHALGGKFRIHHGMANALLLPYCMLFNRPVIEEKARRIARHLELPRQDFTGLLDWVLEQRSALGVPHCLADVPACSGLDARALAPVALADSAMGGNPRPATMDEMTALIERARSGRVD